MNAFSFLCNLFVLGIASSRLGTARVEGEWLSWDLHLSHGLHIPRVGLGTAALGDRTADVVSNALSVGVRLIDSAQAQEWYSELGVGEGISNYCQQSQERRNELWDLVVVTKVHPRSYQEERMRGMLSRSLNLLYSKWNPSKESLDVVLLHSPFCWTGHCSSEEDSYTWQGAWRILEKVKEEGAVRAIGVSNFDLDQLKELEKLSNTKIAIVQNWMDPFHQDVLVREFCKAHNIVYMAYSSFGTQWEVKFSDENPVLTDKTLCEIAKNRQTTVTAVITSWLLQEDVLAIPRASRLDHLRENSFLGKRSSNGSLPIFLTSLEMNLIRGLDGSLGLPWN